MGAQLTTILLLTCLTVLPVEAASSARPAAKSPVPDAAIDAALRAKLSRSKIGADHFQFRVQNGVVTWTGKTDVIQHKGSATRMAKSAGARQVDNRIQVSEAAKAKAAARLERGHQRGSSQNDSGLKHAQVTRGS